MVGGGEGVDRHCISMPGICRASLLPGVLSRAVLPADGQRTERLTTSEPRSLGDAAPGDSGAVTPTELAEVPCWPAGMRRRRPPAAIRQAPQSTLGHLLQTHDN